MLLKAVLMLIIVASATAPSEIDCNFDNDLCQWRNDPNNWKINWKITSMDKIGYIAPDVHENGGVCLKSPMDLNDQILTARLWGPELNQKLSCISFQYRMEGGDNVKLTLMRREMGSCEQTINEKGVPSVTCANPPIWTTKNAERNLGSWTTALVSLSDSGLGDYKLILEGTIPSGNPNAKICVDNITSSASPCEVSTTAPIIAQASYSSWVELYGMTFAGALALGLTIPIAVFVVCLFERKRRRGKKNNRIIRHADELDLPEGMTSASCDETNPLPQRFMNPQVGVGHPRLMGRAMSTPAGTNGQGGNYTMGKRNGPQPGMGVRSTSGHMSHTMGRGGLDSGWMMSSQHGGLMENDEYTIDPDYTTHRQTSVPANGYIPVASSMGQVDASMSQGQINASMSAGYSAQNRPIPQPQSIISVSNVSNNPFGTPVTAGMNSTVQDTRSITGSHAANFGTDENRATPGLPFYPPRYEEAMGFNQSQMQTMEEKPPLLPPRVPETGSSGSAGTSCSTPLPPAPPPLPMSSHPSSGRFVMPNLPGGSEQ